MFSLKNVVSFLKILSFLLFSLSRPFSYGNLFVETVCLTPAVIDLAHQLRCMSSFVNVDKQGKVAVLELNRKPVNSFSLDFLEEINEELDKLETDKECLGLIITSVC